MESVTSIIHFIMLYAAGIYNMRINTSVSGFRNTFFLYAEIF